MPMPAASSSAAERTHSITRVTGFLEELFFAFILLASHF
jgi:hypothetical protein